MENYDIKPLASRGIDNSVISSNFGEILRTVDSEIFNNEILVNILKNPNMIPKFRLFVLNPDESVNYEIPQEDIILDSGSFNDNYQNGQRKSLSISLVNIDGKYTPNQNSIWVHTKFRFDIGIENDNNIIWFPRGIYILANPNAQHNDSDKQATLNFLDKFAIFDGKRGTLETTYEIPVNSDIEQAIIGILTLDDGSGLPLDLQPIIYDKAFKGLKTPYTISKDAGGTLGEILLEIGTILNAEVYYNSQGNLCFISINETALDQQKASLWDYTDNEAEYFTSSATYDFENAVNEVHVVGDNINNDLAYAFAINNNPSSPINIQTIGRRVEYINDTNISSDQLAQDRAAYELRKYGILNTTVNINVSFNPLLLVNNLITLEDSYYNWKRENFLIQSISYTIGTDCQMSLTCSNVNDYSADFNLIPSIKDNVKTKAIINWEAHGSNRYGGILLSLSYNDLDYQKIYLDSPNMEDWNKQLELNLAWKKGFNSISIGVIPGGLPLNNVSLSIKDSKNIINETMSLNNIETLDDYSSIIKIEDFDIDWFIGDITIEFSMTSDYENEILYNVENIMYTDDLIIHQGI